MTGSGQSNFQVCQQLFTYPLINVVTEVLKWKQQSA